MRAWKYKLVEALVCIGRSAADSKQMSTHAYIYIYICIHVQGFWSTFWYPGSPIGDPGLFFSILASINASRTYLDRLGSAKQVLDVKKIIRYQFSLILLFASSVCVYFILFVHDVLCISMISKVWQTWRAFGVHLLKKTGMSSVMDRICAGNDVLQKETIICATPAVKTKTEPLNCCSQRAVRVHRSDLDDLFLYIYIYICSMYT